jgi:hypothetical protein
MTERTESTDQQIRFMSVAYCRGLHPLDPCDEPCDSCWQKAERTLNRMPWWTPAGLLRQDMDQGIDYLGITREIAAGNETVNSSQR